MKRPCALLAVVIGFAVECPAVEAPGGRIVRVLKWDEVSVGSGATVSNSGPEGASSVLIRRADSSPVTLALFALEKPGVETKAYAWRGKIRYQGVEGAGYLETWNQFAPSEPGKPKLRAFSRSLAEVGPFSKISGSSPWRDLFIPFDATGANGQVERIEFNLVLPGRGEVEIADLELIEFADAGAMFASMGAGSAPQSFGLSGAAFIVQLAAVGLFLVAIIGVIVLIIVRKRRSNELRRMKAMDAM